MPLMDETVINFNGGILGFPDLHTFRLEWVEDSPFAYLHSKDDENIEFLTISPFEWFEQYEFTLEDSVRSRLQISDQGNVLVLTIVTAKEPVEQSTVNLLAPLVINVETLCGTQYVIQGQEGYKINHPLNIQLKDGGGE